MSKEEKKRRVKFKSRAERVSDGGFTCRERVTEIRSPGAEEEEEEDSVPLCVLTKAMEKHSNKSSPNVHLIYTNGLKEKHSNKSSPKCPSYLQKWAQANYLVLGNGKTF